MPNNINTPSISIDKQQKENEPFTVNEIIGQSPGWILHSGMTVLFIVVSIGIAMTFVIRYPDKIQAFGVITTVDPFKPIISQSSGIVDTVFVQNQDIVEIDTPLFYIKNTADRKDVEECLKQVDELEQSLPTILPSVTLRLNDPISTQEYGATPYEIRPSILRNWKEHFILGPNQSSFASLSSQVRELSQYLIRQEHILKLQAIDREIEEIQLLNKVLEEEKKLTGEEVNLSNKDVERNQQLYDQGIISEREMERSQASHLGVRKNYLLKGNNMAQNRIRIASLHQQRTEILASRREQILLYQSRITEIILNLRNQYRQWHRQYYMEAPARGRVQLSSDLVAGQTIPAGKSIGYLLPESIDRDTEQGSSNFKYAKVYVPATGVGKISTGNRAIIRLEAYPYKEYGSIDTYVEEIYPIAEVQENGTSIYEVHLTLDSLLTTDYGYPIHYTPDMPVQVNIIAEERSLFSRIFDQFLNLVKTHGRASKPSKDDRSIGSTLSSFEEQSHVIATAGRSSHPPFYQLYQYYVKGQDHVTLTPPLYQSSNYVSVIPPQAINYILHTKN